MTRVAALYRAKRDAFSAALRKHLGNQASWTDPEGGLFFWVTLNGDVSPEALLQEALKEGVLFTPGSHFLSEGGACQAMRLNFSLVSPEDAERGLAVLGKLLRKAAA
jgi:DNA-binding transcriptional MocR family regulator